MSRWGISLLRDRSSGRPPCLPVGPRSSRNRPLRRALKAAIASTGVEPTQTHDLVFLTLCCDAELQRTLARIDVAVLSAVLSRSRYPEIDDPPINHDQATQWIADARDVVAAAAHHLDIKIDSLRAV